MEEISIAWADEKWLNAEYKPLAEKFIREYVHNNLLYVPREYLIVADLLRAERDFASSPLAYQHILKEHEPEIKAWITDRGFTLKALSTVPLGPQDIFPKFESYLVDEPHGGSTESGCFWQANIKGNFENHGCRLGKLQTIEKEGDIALYFLLLGDYSSVYFMDPSLRELGPPIRILGSPDGELEILSEN